MLVAMLTQLPLPTTPEPAVEIAPGVGLVECPFRGGLDLRGFGVDVGTRGPGA